MEKNKTGMYLKYTIGEIVLVVVWILHCLFSRIGQGNLRVQIS